MATITDVQVFGIIIFLLLVILIKEVLIPTAFNCEFGSIRMENKRKGNFIITTTEDDFLLVPKFCAGFFSDQCENNPCPTGFTCSYSSTPLNGNYYRCTGTADLVSLYLFTQCLENQLFCSFRLCKMLSLNIVFIFISYT